MSTVLKLDSPSDSLPPTTAKSKAPFFRVFSPVWPYFVSHHHGFLEPGGSYRRYSKSIVSKNTLNVS